MAIMLHVFCLQMYLQWSEATWYKRAKKLCMFLFVFLFLPLSLFIVLSNSYVSVLFTLGTFAGMYM